MMFVLRRLQEARRAEKIPLYICFIYFIKGYDSVDQSTLWSVLARFVVSVKKIAVIREFEDGMRACALDDGECSDWFSFEQGPRQ